MMIYPPIAELVEKTGSRYTLVIETAKRARQLVAGAPALSDVKTSKEVTMAVNEIYEGKVEAVEVRAPKDEDTNAEAGANETTEENDLPKFDF